MLNASGEKALSAPMLRKLKSARYGGSGNVTRLYFDEQGLLHGDREGLDGDPNGPLGATASYSKPFVGRPGMWGSFNLLSATVGAV